MNNCGTDCVYNNFSSSIRGLLQEFVCFYLLMASWKSKLLALLSLCDCWRKICSGSRCIRKKQKGFCELSRKQWQLVFISVLKNLLDYINILLALWRRTFSLELIITVPDFCVDTLYGDHRPDLDIIIIVCRGIKIAKVRAEDYESVGAGLEDSRPRQHRKVTYLKSYSINCNS